MSELNSITKEVSPNSLTSTIFHPERNVEDLNATLATHFKFDLDEQSKFKEGAVTEKMNNTLATKMMLQAIIAIIDDGKQPIGDKVNEALYSNNKRIMKELTFGLFNALNNYTYNDRHMKVLLLGKVIQSLHGKY
jgi:hypothetical protein